MRNRFSHAFFVFRDFCSFRLKWPKNPLHHKISIADSLCGHRFLQLFIVEFIEILSDRNEKNFESD